MHFSRFFFASSRRHLSPIQRLCTRFGPSSRIQLVDYSKTSGNSKSRQLFSSAVQPDENASPSWVVYAADLIPGESQHPNRVSVKGPTIGGPFTLINTRNQVVTEKDFQGKWVLLYFGYTFSPDVGPEQVNLMANTINLLDKEKIEILPVFVSLDPQRDNPSHVQSYLKEFDHRILGFTGPVASVRQMAQEYRVFFRKLQEDGDDYLVDTSHNMYLINPNVEIVKCFGIEYNAVELAEVLKNEITKSFR